MSLTQPPLPPPPPPPPKPEPKPKAQAKPAAPTPAPPRAQPAKARPRLKVRLAKKPPPPDVKPLPASTAPKTEAPAVEVSEASLTGARTAGGGGGGGGSGGGGDCDMVRRLQSALRRDADVRAAAAQASRGRALMVWNGEWVRSTGEEGKGLAGVRQAIIMEVGFAPAACRAEPMRGLVLISLADAPGAPRLVLGQGRWRWSDLLFAPGAVAVRR